MDLNLVYEESLIMPCYFYCEINSDCKFWNKLLEQHSHTVKIQKFTLDNSVLENCSKKWLIWLFILFQGFFYNQKKYTLKQRFPVFLLLRYNLQISALWNKVRALGHSSFPLGHASLLQLCPLVLGTILLTPVFSVIQPASLSALAINQQSTCHANPLFFVDHPFRKPNHWARAM